MRAPLHCVAVCSGALFLRVAGSFLLTQIALRDKICIAPHISKARDEGKPVSAGGQIVRMYVQPHRLSAALERPLRMGLIYQTWLNSHMA